MRQSYRANRQRRRAISRRSLLRGAGTIALGLPWLEEMQANAAAGEFDGPSRLCTLFFPLGLDPSAQKDFSGPLEPYKPMAERMAIFNNVSAQYCGGGGAHCEQKPVLFVGENKKGKRTSGGASIDLLVKQHLHPNGPPTPIAQLSTGVWWAHGDCNTSMFHSWNQDGTVAETPIKRPSVLFEKLFGGKVPKGTTNAPDPERLAYLNVQRSVLDSVIDQYDRLRGSNSYLGIASREKIDAHFQRLRELERKMVDVDGMLTATQGCQIPGEKPVDPKTHRPYEDDYGGPVFTVKIGVHQEIFRMHSDLWAMGLRCDLFRFGSLFYDGCGDNVGWSGDYEAFGQKNVFTNIGQTVHTQNIHKGNRKMAAHFQHWVAHNLYYYLQQLDDPMFLEANGQTVLDNMLVVIGTEYGWNHSLKDIFHAFVGAKGKFKPGFYQSPHLLVDVMNAAVGLFGMPQRIGERTNLKGRKEITGLLT